MLKCYHCHGEISKGMNIVVGKKKKKYHTYCDGVVKRQDKNSQQQGTHPWFSFFWPMLLLPILTIRS